MSQIIRMNFFRFLFSKAFLKQLLIAIVVAVLLVFVALYWLKFSTNHNEYIEVPNLAKLELDIVELKLNELNLRYEIIDSSSYDPDFPAYSVIEQLPKEGSFVKENRKIYLSLNPSGYPQLELPTNVVGKSLRQAKPTLLSLGFQIGEIKEVPYMADVVLHMLHEKDTLKEGELLTKTSVIDLVVGDGKLKYGQKPVFDTIPKIDSLRIDTTQELDTALDNFSN